MFLVLKPERLVFLWCARCVHYAQRGECQVCLWCFGNSYEKRGRDVCVCHIQTGENEMDNYFDLNPYIDRILDVVLKYGGDRKVIFSTFHADACIM